MLVIYYVDGGLERSAVSMANTLSKLHSVTLLSICGKHDTYEIEKEVEVKYLGLESSSKTIMDKIKNRTKRYKCFKEEIKKIQPDIVLVMNYTELNYFCQLRHKYGFLLVGTERSNPLKDPVSKIAQAIKYFFANRCDGFIFQTNRAKECYPKKIQKKSIVIPNAVFNPLIDLLPEKIEKKNEISAMGRLEKVKGFDLLIKAFARVSKKHLGYILKIYGEGSQKQELEKLIKDLKLNEKVQLVGERKDAILKIAESKIFVLSSHYEGMPNALLEAMACGIACISTNCDMGPAELITNNENGILVPVNDEKAMVEKILYLIENESERKKICQKAKEIKETHNIYVMNDKLLKYFEELLNRKVGKRKGNNEFK